MCPAFSDHALTRQTSITACLCRIGYLWNGTTQKCDQCPAGNFNNKVNDTRCFKCVSSSDILPVYGNPLENLAYTCGASATTQCPCMSVYNEFTNVPCQGTFDANLQTFSHTWTTRASRIYLDFGESRQVGAFDIIADATNLIIMAGDWCVISNNYDNDTSSTLKMQGPAGNCSRPVPHQIYTGPTIQLTFLQTINPLCDVGTTEGDNMRYQIFAQNLINFESGVNNNYLTEDVQTCWRGSIPGNTLTTIIMVVKCKALYFQVIKPEGSNDLRLYTSTCVKRQSDGASCPGLCASSPVGYQNTLWGANLKECLVTSYHNGSFMKCT